MRFTGSRTGHEARTRSRDRCEYERVSRRSRAPALVMMFSLYGAKNVARKIHAGDFVTAWRERERAAPSARQTQRSRITRRLRARASGASRPSARASAAEMMWDKMQNAMKMQSLPKNALASSAAQSSQTRLEGKPCVR